MIGYIAAFFSLLGLAFNAKQNIWCWPIWIFANCIWLGLSFYNHDIPQIILWSLYNVFNIYGWVKWHKKA